MSFSNYPVKKLKFEIKKSWVVFEEVSSFLWLLGWTSRTSVPRCPHRRIQICSQIGFSRKMFLLRLETMHFHKKYIHVLSREISHFIMTEPLEKCKNFRSCRFWSSTKSWIDLDGIMIIVLRFVIRPGWGL